MNRYLKLFLYGVLSSVLFTVLIYNVTVIALYIDSILKTSIEKVADLDNIIIYSISVIFYFFNFLIAFRKFSVEKKLTFLAIVGPAILIDLTTFINGIELIPLRFPFATLFPIFGGIAGLFWLNKKKTYLILFGGSIIVFLFLSKAFFIPQIIYYMENRSSQEFSVKGLDNNWIFSTIDNNKIKILDTLRGKCTLLEFYFVGCKPCEQKMVALHELNQKIKSRNFRIFFICDGIITNYSNFLKHAKKNISDNISFFYDKDSVLQKVLDISGYPFEILVNNKGEIISKRIGFDEEITSLYIEKNSALINKLINEN